MKVLFTHQNSLRHVLKQIVVYGSSSLESFEDPDAEDLKGLLTNFSNFTVDLAESADT